MNPDPGKVFKSLEELVSHCKEKGIMLYLDVIGGIVDDQVHGKICQLSTALARPVTVFDPFSEGMFFEPSDIWVSPEVRDELQKEMENEDSPARRLSTRPIERSFLYLDVSDFSKHPPGQQALIINSIVRIVNDQFLWMTTYGMRAFRKYEAMLCIGDGFIFVFRLPGDATFFGAHLAFVIETMVARKLLPVEFHFRMGIHIGLVFSFWDFDRQKWNYIGEGINGGNRVLTAVGRETDDVLFISDQVKKSIIDQRPEFSQSIVANLQNRGRRLDKHGNPWRVYELNHMALCGMETPPALLETTNTPGSANSS